MSRLWKRLMVWLRIWEFYVGLDVAGGTDRSACVTAIRKRNGEIHIIKTETW